MNCQDGAHVIKVLLKLHLSAIGINLPFWFPVVFS